MLDSDASRDLREGGDLFRALKEEGDVGQQSAGWR